MRDVHDVHDVHAFFALEKKITQSTQTSKKHLGKIEIAKIGMDIMDIRVLGSIRY